VRGATSDDRENRRWVGFPGGDGTAGADVNLIVIRPDATFLLRCVAWSRERFFLNFPEVT
jgi:hypothetical protein